jgi:hypothetical protein
MIDSQRELFDATMTHPEQTARNDPPPAERSARLMDVRQNHIALCDKVKHEVIGAELLTSNSEIEAALKDDQAGSRELERADAGRASRRQGRRVR